MPASLTDHRECALEPRAYEFPHGTPWSCVLGDTEESNVLAEPQKAWSRVEVTAQSWLVSSPNSPLCVCACVLPKPQSTRGTNQGLMQEGTQHGCDVPESGEVENQGTSFAGNLLRVAETLIF